MARSAAGKVVIKDDKGNVLGEQSYAVVAKDATRASMDAIIVAWPDSAVRRAINHANASDARAILKLRIEGPAKRLASITADLKALGKSDDEIAAFLNMLK